MHYTTLKHSYSGIMQLVFSFIFSLFFFTAFSQNYTQKGNRDIDGDGLPDSLAVRDGRIKVRLSSQNYQPILSGDISGDGLSANLYFSYEKDGFSYRAQYMRAGHSAEFQYDKKTGKIKLIGLGHWDAPSGYTGGDESDFDLPNHRLTLAVEEWNPTKQTFIDLPNKDYKVYFPDIYLENYSSELSDYYLDMVSNIDNQEDLYDKNFTESTIDIKPGKIYSWIGKIGKNIPVFIHYQITNTTYFEGAQLVIGEIIYLKTKSQKPITLLGYKTDEGTLRLNEYAKDGEVTGVITADIKRQLFKGTWVKPYSDKEYTVKLRYMGIEIPKIDYQTNAADIFGEYHYYYGVKGPQGEVKLKKVSDKKAGLSMSAVTGAPARNIADGGNEISIPRPSETEFNYTIPRQTPQKDGCLLKLLFFKKFMLITYPQGDKKCRVMFGHNASLNGIYYKVK